MQKWSCRLSVAQVGSVGLQSSFVRHAKNISLIFQDTAKIGLTQNNCNSESYNITKVFNLCQF